MKTVVRTVRDVDLLALSYQPQGRNHDLPAKQGRRTAMYLLSLIQGFFAFILSNGRAPDACVLCIWKVVGLDISLIKIRNFFFRKCTTLESLLFIKDEAGIWIA